MCYGSLRQRTWELWRYNWISGEEGKWGRFLIIKTCQRSSFANMDLFAGEKLSPSERKCYTPKLLGFGNMVHVVSPQIRKLMAQPGELWV